MKSKYTHSTHCVYNIGYHLIWCTKYRKKLIYGKVEHSLKHLIRYKCDSLGIAVGVAWRSCPTISMCSYIPDKSLTRRISCSRSKALLLTGSASFILLFRENGKHPRCGANPIFAKASDIYLKILSGGISPIKNSKDNGFALRFHLRVKTPQYSRLLS